MILQLINDVLPLAGCIHHEDRSEFESVLTTAQNHYLHVQCQGSVCGERYDYIG